MSFARGQNGTVGRSSNGVYAGHDGNVYRRNAKGTGASIKTAPWNQVERSAPETRDLDSSVRARERGQAETQRQRQARPRAGGGRRR